MSPWRDLLPCNQEPDAKIGLALSGGGFRAAFFHVGVLARLAELGILPRVEVISTVSGGSIVGAAYYLRLRALLNEKADADITANDYRGLVEEVAELLHDAVAQHIRGRVFANPLKNVAMLLSPSYSRSDRIGDLYDRYLYKPAWEEPRERRRGWREEQIELRELRIEPHGDRAFDPRKHNPDRRAKAPVLLLNATTLNSGHNWRFEAVRMGEPLPGDSRRREIVEETDKNMRLRPGYFPRKQRQADDPPVGEPHVPTRQEDFPLALAVAASACVPGVFHPIAISGMYRGDGKRVRVRLVDGGVQDNQGVQGLLDNGCNRLIVSDASGQLDDKNRPWPWIIPALLRSAGIGRDRIRDEQLTYLPAGNRKYALMHLRKGIDPTALSPSEDSDRTATSDTELKPEYGSEKFGVDPDVQRALSDIRTDLDFFSEIEAHSLELDGYLMARTELALRDFGALGDPDLTLTSAPAWPFLALEEEILEPGKNYMRKLRVGHHKFFRVVRLRPVLGLAMGLVCLLAAGAVLKGACALADVLDLSWPLHLVGALLIAFAAVCVWSNVTAWTTRRLAM